MSDLVDRGLVPEQGMPFVIDGAKALSKAIRTVFGEHAEIQRCIRHYADPRIMPTWCRNPALGAVIAA